MVADIRGALGAQDKMADKKKEQAMVVFPGSDR